MVCFCFCADCNCVFIFATVLFVLSLIHISMGYNYNGKLRSAEILLCEDGSAKMIRRAETPKDYFATFDFTDFFKG